MVTERRRRMTELFGRLTPGATLDAARAELTSAHACFACRLWTDRFAARGGLTLDGDAPEGAFFLSDRREVLSESLIVAGNARH
jgi:hypothetical protein